MSSATRTILVTGFEPFGGETVNSSWEAARKLDGWRIGEYAAVARLLPCAYDASVKKLIQAIETLRPEAVLMAGQAARRGVVCVERFARNLDDAAAADNGGGLRTAAQDLPRRARMARDGGAGQRIAERYERREFRRGCRGTPEGLSATISISARCNICATSGSATPAVFVHLPATPEQTRRREREAAHSGRGGEGAPSRSGGDDRLIEVGETA